MSINIDEVAFDFECMDSTFSKLDLTAIKEIMKKYYSNEMTATNIIEKYKLETTPAKLYRSFPCVEMEARCPYDDTNFVVSMPAKGNFNFFLQGYGDDLFCPTCGHKDIPDCNCSNCKLKEEREIVQKKNKIKNKYDHQNWESVSEEKLSLKDRLYIAALLRGFMDENQMYITPTYATKSKLGPTSDYSIKILKHLIARGLIIPATISELSSFLEDDFPQRYYVDRVSYQLLIDSNDDKNSMIGRLMYPDRQMFLNDKQETFSLWKDIAESEAEEYLLYRMSAVGFDFNIGVKTKMVLNNLLERFSVGQINSFTYRAVANSLQWYTENTNISRKHAANSVVSRLEKSGERALSEGWKVKSWGRNYDLKQSEISEVLYNPIMQISELGFTEVPTVNF